MPPEPRAFARPVGPEPPATVGSTADGRPVLAATIAGQGLAARVLSWGATLQGLWLDGVARSLTLSLDSLDAYLGPPLYVGALAGRFANRIAGAQVTLDGRTHALDRNWLGRHTLHGGRDGSGTRPWRLAAWSEAEIRLEDTLPDGHMGFPGTLAVAATYAIRPGPVLALRIEATSDAPTPCSFAQHSYWTLGQGGDARALRLTLAADAYLPVDAELLPLDGPAPVAGTAFDFRSPRSLADALPPGGFDHNFCLAPRRAPCRPVAELHAPGTGVTMELATTEPGLQLFDGAPTGILPGHDAHAGLALEPQLWPDAPNRPGFPDAWLRPGATYRQQTEYRFRRATAG